MDMVQYFNVIKSEEKIIVGEGKKEQMTPEGWVMAKRAKTEVRCGKIGTKDNIGVVKKKTHCIKK